MRHERQSVVGVGGKDYGLTPRETQIITLVVAGYTDKAIASTLNIALPVAKRDLASILEKLAVANRLELMLFALHHELTGTAPGSRQHFNHLPRGTFRASGWSSHRQHARFANLT